MASALREVKKRLGIKGKGKKRDDKTQGDKESASLPDVVREAPISQASTSSQKSYVGSKKSDLKSTGGSLDSELSNLNLEDMSDEKCPKDTQEGVAAATAQACGNNYCQGASGVSSEPPNNSSEETHNQVPNVPDPADDNGAVSADPNSEVHGDGFTRGEQTHTQVPNMPEFSNTDGGIPTDPNSEASGDGITHSEQTHNQVSNLPEPANTDGGVSTDANSEASRDGITHSEQPHTQVLNVPTPVNNDELVNPNSNNEVFRDDRNQERNAVTAGRTEAPNLNQEATVPVAAAETVPLNPDGTNLGCLTRTPIQEESVDTVEEGATRNEGAPSEEAANNYDHLCVSDVIAKDKFLQDKLARELDHTPHRVIKTWEHLACTKEVNAPLETRFRFKLSSENSCTMMLIDFLSVEMGDKTVHDLIEALKAINRHDVVKMITAVYSENSTEEISDFATSNANSEMIKAIATKLDQKSRVNGYWINLGQQFKISGEKLKEIEYGQSNPAFVLMEYLYSKQEDLTVGRFYEEVKNLKRGDVLKKLEPSRSSKFC